MYSVLIEVAIDSRKFHFLGRPIAEIEITIVFSLGPRFLSRLSLFLEHGHSRLRHRLPRLRSTQLYFARDTTPYFLPIFLFSSRFLRGICLAGGFFCTEQQRLRHFPLPILGCIFCHRCIYKLILNYWLRVIRFLA